VSESAVSRWSALALAAVGLFAMALVGAAPGSPYQPLLTPAGQPHGPLTALAVRLGLAREGLAPGRWLARLKDVIRAGVADSTTLTVQRLDRSEVGENGVDGFHFRDVRLDAGSAGSCPAIACRR